MKSFFKCAIMALSMLACGLSVAAQSEKLIELKIVVTDEDGNAYDWNKYEINCDLTDGAEILQTGIYKKDNESCKIYLKKTEKPTKVKARIWLGIAETKIVDNYKVIKEMDAADEVESKTIEIDLGKAKACTKPKNVYKKIEKNEDGKKIATPIETDELEVKVTLAHK